MILCFEGATLPLWPVVQTRHAAFLFSSNLVGRAIVPYGTESKVQCKLCKISLVPQIRVLTRIKMHSWNLAACTLSSMHPQMRSREEKCYSCRNSRPFKSPHTVVLLLTGGPVGLQACAEQICQFNPCSEDLPPEKPVASFGPKRQATVKRHESIHDTSVVYGISGMVNPKYEA